MTISFRYKSTKRPDGTDVKIPSIPITLEGAHSFETVALLDSGADISAMPKNIADVLGLRLDGKKTPAFGIGGKVDAVEGAATIVVEKGHERYRFNIPIKVILGKYDFPVLLGRAGFFDKFVIIFDQAQERVSLKRVTRR